MEEQKIIKKLSAVGIFGNVLLAVFKLFSGVIGKSGAMISDAVHSLSDVFATLVAFIGVVLSKRPEDREHPYGHERIECVASLILGLILAGTGIGIGYSGVQKLISRETIEVPTLLPLIAAVISIIVKEAMFWYTMHYAKKMDSPAFLINLCFSDQSVPFQQHQGKLFIPVCHCILSARIRQASDDAGDGIKM